MFKPTLALTAAALAALIALPVLAQDPVITPIVGGAAVSELTGEVMVVNTETRLMTIKDADGKFHVLHVPPEVTRLDRIRIGNRVTVMETTSVLIERIEGAPGLMGSTARVSVERDPGAKPGGTISDEVTMFGQVEGVDRSAGTVTVRGENGNRTFDVDNDAVLDELSPGDGVVARIRNTISGEVTVR